MAREAGTGIYVDRTARRHRDHRHPGGHVAARVVEGEATGGSHDLHEQHASDHDRSDHIRQ